MNLERKQLDECNVLILDHSGRLENPGEVPWRVDADSVELTAMLRPHLSEDDLDLLLGAFDERTPCHMHFSADGEEYRMHLIPVGGGEGIPGFIALVGQCDHSESYPFSFREVVESSVDIITVVDEEGRIIYETPSSQRHLGYTPEEVIGTDGFDRMHPEDVPRIMEMSQRGMEGELESGRGEFRLRHRDGSWKHFEGIGRPIPGEEGQEITVVFAREISARKRAERRLSKALQKAEKAAKAKSQFLANMSHELRTPLNGVVGMIELLLQTDLSEKQYEYAQTALISSNTLLSLIDDVLDFSKLDADQLELESISIDMAEIAYQSCNMMARSAHEKGIELNCRVDPELPARLKGDPTRVRQIFTNLLSNAVKFTEEGEVNLSVICRRLTESECSLSMEVSDTGIGIPEEKQEEIFRSFTQADASTTREFGGSGLGLAIVRELVLAMDGELDLTSTPGEGTTFHIELTLPLAEQEDDSSPADRAEELAVSRVLVVDDNATNRKILTQQLEHRGAEVETVSNAEEALEVLKSTDGFQPELVISDHLMPEMDGVELRRRMNEFPGIAEIPTLLLTSAVRAENFGESEGAEFSAVLSKPVSGEELTRAVNRAVGEEPESSISTEPSSAAETTGPELHSLRILIAEDNQVNLRVTHETLERHGVEHIGSAQTGREALEKLDEGDWDVVLMDIQMPEMDGLEATRAIRERTDLGEIPIIAMTAHADSDTVHKALEAGMDEYITKPVRSAELLAELEKHVPMSEPDEAGTVETSEPRERATEPSQFNRAELSGRLGGSEEVMPDVLNIFLDESEQLLKDLEESLAEGHLTDVEESAHTCKGMLANLAAQRARERAEALEQAASAGELKVARETFESLKRAVNALREEVESVLDGVEK